MADSPGGVPLARAASGSPHRPLRTPPAFSGPRPPAARPVPVSPTALRGEEWMKSELTSPECGPCVLLRHGDSSEAAGWTRAHCCPMGKNRTPMCRFLILTNCSEPERECRVCMLRTPHAPPVWLPRGGPVPAFPGQPCLLGGCKGVHWVTAVSVEPCQCHLSPGPFDSTTSVPMSSTVHRGHGLVAGAAVLSFS